MPEYKPLYRYTLINANEFEEVEQWRESHRENCKCANDITDAINSHYHDNRLDDCVKPLLDKYGFDRVNWVIANTIREVCPPRKNRQKTQAKNRMKRMTNIIQNCSIRPRLFHGSLDNEPLKV